MMEKLPEEEYAQAKQELAQMTDQQVFEYKRRVSLEIQDRQIIWRLLDAESELRAMKYEQC